MTDHVNFDDSLLDLWEYEDLEDSLIQPRYDMEDYQKTGNPLIDGLFERLFYEQVAWVEEQELKYDKAQEQHEQHKEEVMSLQDVSVAQALGPGYLSYLL